MSDNRPEQPLDGDERGPRDYTAENVPQEADYYPERRDQLPQSEIDRDEARDSLNRADDSSAGIKGKLGAGVGDLKAQALNAGKDKLKQTVGDAVPGGEQAQEVVEKAQKAAAVGGKLVSDVKNVAAVAKGVAPAIFNPYTLIAIAAVIVITCLVISAMAFTQVYGQSKSTSTEGASAGAMQQRLAQRAEWLQQHFSNYPDTGSLTDPAPGPKSNLGSNEWGGACPNIVAIIYGLSPYLVNYMGSNNAYLNYRAHPEFYEAWAFTSGNGPYGPYGDGTSTPGASVQNPPAGAIVSVENESRWYNTSYPGAGHTFVMLTDELIIDNFGGGGITHGGAGQGPRTLNDTMRSHIVGWALPKQQGFEGTFLTGMFDGAAEGAPDQPAAPDLPPVPTWAAGAGEAGTGGTGGGSYSGPEERKNWMRQAGIAESDWTYVDYIATKESSWNPRATNAESGACGLIQALPCSKVPGDGYNPVDNLRWANGYAKSRYGSWQAAYNFWTANHWW